MELKVWVDGVVRVVCGLSPETSCQDVVIALAQAIGQTGRYVLIQKLRDTERQLLADERPLESLAKLGQSSSEVQFFLRRTGPSSSESVGSERKAGVPRRDEPEPRRRDAPQKSLTFNLGPSSSPRPKQKQPKQPGPSHSPSKEEVFRTILQQQARLKALETQLEAAQNEEAEEEEQRWEEELRIVTEEEQHLRQRLDQLRLSMDDCGRRLENCNASAARLQRDVQQESRRTKQRSGEPSPSPEEVAGSVRAELKNQQQKGAELETSVSEMEKLLDRAEAMLQAKNEEMDELNKELRQCNLQQFIQQTGNPTAHVSDPPDGPIHNGYGNSGPAPFRTESPPRPTAKQFLGNPRNLQNPLVSSLNPEVLTSREASWR